MVFVQVDFQITLCRLETLFPDITLILTLSQEAYLKKIDRGAQLIFLGLRFLIFLFFWVWKIFYFFGSEDVSLIFWG